MTALAVGLMAGTSLDGVDAALVAVDETTCDVLGFHTVPYGPALRGRLEAAMESASAAELTALHGALGEEFAAAVRALLEGAGRASSELAFVASHGQTIWHEPPAGTLQIGNPAVIAEVVGRPVVSDFRSADVAAGGQGAPLVPMADVMLFGATDHPRILLNIGGMANVTWVERRTRLDGVVAFDTGPGVALIDMIARAVDPGAPFDVDGARAARGRVVTAVLESRLADPYFTAPPPKSTGREHYGRSYATDMLLRVRAAGGSDDDALATATAFTAQTIAAQIQRWLPDDPDADVVVSGGGAKNGTLVTMLRAALTPRPVAFFTDLFFDGDAKEAASFAYLGWRTLEGLPGNVPAATGAAGLRVLGSVTGVGNDV
jgi:anhydro-N-acetylmuramic acid kinase